MTIIDGLAFSATDQMWLLEFSPSSLERGLTNSQPIEVIFEDLRSSYSQHHSDAWNL